MKYSLSLLVSLLVLSCSTSRDFDKENMEEIKHDSEFSEEKSVVLKGKAIYKMNYCGGARPPKNWLKSQPFQNVKNTTLIYRKVGSPDMEFKVKTDSLGLFSIRLYEGVWRYHLTESFKGNNAPNSYDVPAECDKFYNSPYGSLEIKIDAENDTVYGKDISFYKEIKSLGDKTKTDSIYFYLPCNPCALHVRP
jgi:hypothetical protein